MRVKKTLEIPVPLTPEDLAECVRDLFPDEMGIFFKALSCGMEKRGMFKLDPLSEIVHMARMLRGDAAAIKLFEILLTTAKEHANFLPPRKSPPNNL